MKKLGKWKKKLLQLSSTERERKKKSKIWMCECGLSRFDS